MCQIIGKYTNGNTVTGYKVVYKDKSGNFYSPYTGYKYKVGKIIPLEYDNILNLIPKNDDNYFSNMCKYYFKAISAEREMYGMTGVFLRLRDAQSFDEELHEYAFRNDYDISTAIIEMEITGNLHNARFSSDDIVIGNEILTIKQLH